MSIISARRATFRFVAVVTLLCTTLSLSAHASSSGMAISTSDEYRDESSSFTAATTTTSAGGPATTQLTTEMPSSTILSTPLQFSSSSGSTSATGSSRNQEEKEDWWTSVTVVQESSRTAGGIFVGLTVAGSLLMGNVEAVSDVQTLTVLGHMTCASDAMRYSTNGSIAVLTPLALGGEDVDYRFLLGSGTLLVGCVLVHGAITFLVFKLSKNRTFEQSRMLLRFPSYSIVINNWLMMGMLMQLTPLLYRGGSTVGIILASVLLIVFFAEVGGITMFRRKFLTLDSSSDSTSSDHQKRLVKYTEYQYCYKLAKTPDFLAKYVLPHGRWRAPWLHQVNGLIGRYQRKHVSPLLYLEVSRSLYSALVANVDSETEQGCAIQHYALAGAPLVQAVVMLASRSERIPLVQWMGILTNLVVSFVVMTPAIPGVRDRSAQLVILVGGAPFFMMISKACMLLVEHFYFLKFEKLAEKKVDARNAIHQQDAAAAAARRQRDELAAALLPTPPPMSERPPPVPPVGAAADHSDLDGGPIAAGDGSTSAVELGSPLLTTVPGLVGVSESETEMGMVNPLGHGGPRRPRLQLA